MHECPPVHEKLWKFTHVADAPAQVVHLASLTGAHTKTVNVVRFSRDGTAIASGGDGGEIVVWRALEQQQQQGDARKGLTEAEQEVSWKVACILRGHSDDVQDICWSPDGTMLVSGSVDNTAIIWDAAKGKIVKRLHDHKHYVQGEYLFARRRHIERVQWQCELFDPQPLWKDGRIATHHVSSLSPSATLTVTHHFSPETRFHHRRRSCLGSVREVRRDAERRQDVPSIRGSAADKEAEEQQ